MGDAYRYGRQSVKHRHIWPWVILLLLLVTVPIGALVYYDAQKNGDTAVEGASKVVGQVAGDNTSAKKISEGLFSFSLPSDWKESERRNTSLENSITWISTKKTQENRSLKIYIDTIPSALPVNKLLPVTVRGDKLVAGDVSENCATFTGGGTLSTDKATKLQPSPAKWQGVDFICNLPNVVDNQVGIGAVGAINTIPITGPSKGAHKFFLLYIDRNVQPDYGIATDVVESFLAK